jgi:YidC/Oxa1 family membrane protein insertase
MTTLATTGIVHAVGSIFQPIFKAVGWLLATLYGVIPNYAVAIILLTIIIMGVLTPFTVKSTKSMMAMQRLQPELKKLQQKYKGPENRQTLNEEMMKLYKEEGVNPLGGCLPMLLQAPFLFILYSVIKGLANVTTKGVSQPRYIPKSSAMYHNLVAAHSQIRTFGMDLSLKPFSQHSSWIAAVPYFGFAALAVALQYFQMWQMNNRNRKTGQAIPSQQQAIQRFMPILFAYIYIIIPAAVVLYMIVSTAIRILTQDVMFRVGVSNPQKQQERKLPARTESPEETDKPAAKPTGAKGGVGPAKKSQPSTPKPASHPRSKSKRQRKDR